MVTAIVLSTAIVIAVVIYSILKVSSECSRIEEQESINWVKKWNQQWSCNNDCKVCGEQQFCKLKDEV